MIACAVVLIVVALTEVVMASKAPVGYEDEQGFHYGDGPRHMAGAPGTQ